MSTHKEELRMLLRDPSVFTRFEVLEQFAKIVDEESDVVILQSLLAHDPDPIVRHEAAAQLLQVETNKPELTASLRNQIQQALMKSVREDESVIVRHEAMEALAYVGDESALRVLGDLADDANTDIKCTARIARDILQFRLENKLKGSEFSSALISKR